MLLKEVHELAEEREELVSNTGAATPPGRRRCVKASLLAAAAGLAAAVAVAATRSVRGGAPSASVDEAIDLFRRDERSERSRRSKPFMGGRNGVLDPEEEGQMIITVDGEDQIFYLPGATIEDNGRTVRYVPPRRYYLMKRSTIEYSNADNFHKLYLVGKTFTVDINLNDVGCGCNVNFYLVDMPVATPGADGDYYCDAQCHSYHGCCCEFDMNEGNNRAQMVTNHACTNDYTEPEQEGWACHKWGMPQVFTTPSEFCVGPGPKIDGDRTFTFKQHFRITEQADGTEQLEVITEILQDGDVVSMTMRSDDQLQSMLGELRKGLVFVTGYWTSPHMNWLDGDSCGTEPETCSESPARISNWRIDTIAPPSQ